MQTSHLPKFLQARQHDNDRAVLLINHPPEILSCVVQWCLCNDECILLLVALHGGESYNVFVPSLLADHGL